MSKNLVLEGGCLCGEIRYQTTALPYSSDHCHCSMCRKTTGAVFGTWVDFKSEQVNWTKAQPREFASSEKIRRGFCPTCGGSVSFRHLDHPEYIALASGSLDEPQRTPATCHIYVEDKLPWLTIEDDCQRYKQGMNSESV